MQWQWQWQWCRRVSRDCSAVARRFRSLVQVAAAALVSAAAAGDLDSPASLVDVPRQYHRGRCPRCAQLYSRNATQQQEGAHQQSKHSTRCGHSLLRQRRRHVAEQWVAYLAFGAKSNGKSTPQVCQSMSLPSANMRRVTAAPPVVTAPISAPMARPCTPPGPRRVSTTLALQYGADSHEDTLGLLCGRVPPQSPHFLW